MSLQDSKNWRKGRKCLFKNNVHLVFLTKCRNSVFTIEILDRLKELFIETCSQMDCRLLSFQGDFHYVHIVVSVNPKISISRLVGKLKGKSSYLLTREFSAHLKDKIKDNHLWASSYCVVSHGNNVLETIKQFFSLDIKE